MKVFGLDGYRRGWVAVWIDGNECGLCFLESITDLLRIPHARAMVDIPIGLPEWGNRACDLEARRLLGKNWPRVFTGARRGLLAFESKSHAKANAWAKPNGAGVSIQLFRLIPKIAQVDRVIDKNRQVTLRETHPELVFLRLNDYWPLPSKRTVNGIKTRRALIRKQGIPQVDYWVGRKRLGTGAKADDILDACAAAIAARDLLLHIPDNESQIDGRGLRMEIWY
jgi:predicted RNase H-like nuclease